MINLTQIYDYTRRIIAEDTGLLVNQFTTGDIYDNLNTSEQLYPAINYSLINVQQNTNVVTYSFNVFYADKLLEDNSNKDTIYDDGIQTIKRLINTFSDGVDESGENVNIQVGQTFEVFSEDFADKCAGVFVQVNFQVLNYVGQCHELNVPFYTRTILETFTVEINENGTYEYVSEEGKAWNKLEITVNSTNPELIDAKIEEHNESAEAHPDIRQEIADKQDILTAGEGIEIVGDTISCTATGDVTKEYVDNRDDAIIDAKEPRLPKISSPEVAPEITIEDNREYDLTGELTNLTINMAISFDDDSFAVIKFSTPAILPDNFLSFDASFVGFPTMEANTHYIITFMGVYVSTKSYTIGG